MAIDEMNPSGTASPRRVAGVVAGVVGVAAVAGGGVWVTQSFLAQGPQPAEALPADTLAYVAVDVDPGGEQKIQAAGLLRKFPEARKVVGEGGDLRRQVFEFLAADSDCSASYADVEPWLGKRAALAMVDADDPKPVLVLSVDGDERLEHGLDALGTCFGKRSGHAVAGSWAVIAESDAAAERVVEATAQASLADARGFRDWTAKAGGAGLVTMYVSPRAGTTLVDVTEEHPEAAFLVPSVLGQGDPLGAIVGMVPLFGLMAPFAAEDIGEPEMSEPEWGGAEIGGEMGPPLTEAEIERLETMSPEEADAFFSERYDTPFPTEVMSDEEFPDDMEEMPESSFAPGLPEETVDALRGFDGLGGSLRFEDGTLQLKVVADHLDVGAMRVTDGADAGRLLKELPRGMAVAIGGGLADGWADAATDGFFGGAFAMDGDNSLEREFERSTGLDLPGDLETLGGSGVAFVAGPGFDPEELFDGDGPVPVAAVLHGDEAEIVRVLGKLRGKESAAARQLLWKQDDGRVVVGIDRAFVDAVAAGSGLAGASAYEKVLPDADKAASAMFLDFDAEDWFVELVGHNDRAAVEPLDSLGFSRTVDGGDDVIRLRLATD